MTFTDHYPCLHVNSSVLVVCQDGEMGYLTKLSYIGKLKHWYVRLNDGSEYVTNTAPTILGHLGIEHWEVCDTCGRRTRDGICMDKLWICRRCGHSIDQPGTENCPGCSRPIIVALDGMVYPKTMMGYQAADGPSGGHL